MRIPHILACALLLSLATGCSPAQDPDVGKPGSSAGFPFPAETPVRTTPAQSYQASVPPVVPAQPVVEEQPQQVPQEPPQPRIMSSAPDVAAPPIVIGEQPNQRSFSNQSDQYGHHYKWTSANGRYELAYDDEIPDAPTYINTQSGVGLPGFSGSPSQGSYAYRSSGNAHYDNTLIRTPANDPGKTEHVSGYTNRYGTYVNSYYRHPAGTAPHRR